MKLKTWNGISRPIMIIILILSIAVLVEGLINGDSALLYGGIVLVTFFGILNPLVYFTVYFNIKCNKEY